MPDSSQGQSQVYRHLPEELLGDILEHVPQTVEKMNKMFDIQDEPIKQGIETLKQKNMITSLSGNVFSTSLIAVDGGMVLEKMSGTDILLAVAVGVEGLTEDKGSGWEKGKNQFVQWQTVLPHDGANARLAQGVMFLMEMTVLSNDSHEIRIMDGTHFTPILKVNSLLSSNEEKAGAEYKQALKDFLKETYNKIIPDIPNIISSALTDDKIVAIAKYSSSRDILDAYLKDKNISLDDKTFFTLGLSENEYTKPLSVGQSKEERGKVWNDLHIKCNLKFSDVNDNELDTLFKKIIKPIRTQEFPHKDSSLFFTYFKPFNQGPAYRIEIKKSLADDINRLEKVLLSIKKQIVFPEIREPFPQYLVDLMAKSVAGGLFAIQEAIRLSPELNIDKGKFDLLFPYRT
ncbi:MAG: DNA double-strand break repair nuclease NurA [Candidatus Buchananbacteria bacterium]|nr:DNA double-strand break repair nuclease NurA [Candidatus Buchananbacteria bacterium]